MESTLELQFFQYLSELGFPRSSIIYEPTFQPSKGGRRYRPDYALLDPINGEPLAIIEIKERNDSATLTRATRQISEYIANLRDKTVRGFVVIPKKSGVGFDFYSPDVDGAPKAVPSTWFLQFDALSSARIAEKKEMLAGEKKDTTNEFVNVCYGASSIVVVIVIADFIFSLFGVILLTTERMTLIGASIALIVIPYMQKFKGLGIEIERAVKLGKS